MATSKTLAPTNVTISIPAMTDAPDASVFSNCVDKEADAINALNSHIAIKTHTVQNVTTDTNASFNSGIMVADAIIVGVNATVGTGFISVAGVYNGEWVMQVRNFSTGALKTSTNIGNIEILYRDR